MKISYAMRHKLESLPDRWRSVSFWKVHGRTIDALVKRGLAEVRGNPWPHYEWRRTKAGKKLVGAP